MLHPDPNLSEKIKYTLKNMILISAIKETISKITFTCKTCKLVHLFMCKTLEKKKGNQI